MAQTGLRGATPRWRSGPVAVIPRKGMDNLGTRIDVERLSPRMRQCLARVYARRTTKEIAADLGLSPGTVDGYIAEAVRLLGARNRVDAAERLHAAEASAALLGEDHPEEVAAAGDAPCNSDPRSAGVSAGTAAAPSGPDGGPGTSRWPLPIRTQGAIGNDLGIIQRIGWILFLAIGIAVGIGGVANALRFLSDVARHR